MEWTPTVGQQIRAKINLDNDLTDEGMGIQRYASKGDKLIIRRINSGYKNCISVSHEHITDRTFGVSVDEIEPI